MFTKSIPKLVRAGNNIKLKNIYVAKKTYIVGRKILAFKLKVGARGQ